MSGIDQSQQPSSQCYLKVTNSIPPPNRIVFTLLFLFSFLCFDMKLSTCNTYTQLRRLPCPPHPWMDSFNSALWLLTILRLYSGKPFMTCVYFLQFFYPKFTSCKFFEIYRILQCNYCIDVLCCEIYLYYFVFIANKKNIVKGKIFNFSQVCCFASCLWI